MHKALRDWLSVYDGEWLFPSQRKGKVITAPALNLMIKTWCATAHIELGIKQNGINYGSHTLRKTFGYWQRIDAGVPIHTLMRIFNHSFQAVTLTYLGIQEQEIEDVYMEYEL